MNQEEAKDILDWFINPLWNAHKKRNYSFNDIVEAYEALGGKKLDESRFDPQAFIEDIRKLLEDGEDIERCLH